MSMRRKNFPHDNTPVPRRTPFWSKPQKGAKALWLPGARRLRPTASRNGAELVGGKICFSSCGGGREMSFPLTPAAAESRRRPPVLADAATRRKRLPAPGGRFARTVFCDKLSQNVNDDLQTAQNADFSGMIEPEVTGYAHSGVEHEKIPAHDARWACRKKRDQQNYAQQHRKRKGLADHFAA